MQFRFNPHCSIHCDWFMLTRTNLARWRTTWCTENIFHLYAILVSLLGTTTPLGRTTVESRCQFWLKLGITFLRIMPLECIYCTNLLNVSKLTKLVLYRHHTTEAILVVSFVSQIYLGSQFPQKFF